MQGAPWSLARWPDIIKAGIASAVHLSRAASARGPCPDAQQGTNEVGEATRIHDGIRVHQSGQRLRAAHHGELLGCHLHRAPPSNPKP